MELDNTDIRFVCGEIFNIENYWSVHKCPRKYTLPHGRVERDQEPGCLKIILYRRQ